MMYAPATASAHLVQHLARDRDPFLAGVGPRARLAHTFANRLGDLHARHLVVEELRVAVAGERQEPDEHRQAERRDVVRETLEHLRDRRPAGS